MLPLPLLCLLALCALSTPSVAQPPAPASNAATPTSTFSASSSPFASTSASRNTTTTRTTSSSAYDPSAPPDVYLNVPRLSVGRIELDVADLRADINLNANVANGLVKINAGVAVSVQEVNITIADVSAQLELVVRLGHLVDIVNRVFDSLDLNPLLIGAVNNVTSLLDHVVVGAVDGLLGRVTRGGTQLSFLVDNLGNIVQEVAGAGGADPVSSIVGNYRTNMTFTGAQQSLQDGLVKKTFAYEPLNALVDIVFDAAGRVVQAVVQGKGSGSGSGGGSGSSSGGGGASTTTPAAATTTTPAAR